MASIVFMFLVSHWALLDHHVAAQSNLVEDVKMCYHPSCCQPCAGVQASKFTPHSCQDFRTIGVASDGLSTIFVPSIGPCSPPISLTVFCDQTTSGGGWIVLLRRIDDSENFPTRVWQDYKTGFGNPTVSSFWIGLEQMYQLTRDRHAILRVELEDFDGETRHAEYRYFSISSESHGYRLFVDGYSGNAGDSLTYHSGQKFSTIDRDYDTTSGHCATSYNGAWWYKKCVVCCLTGEYINGHHADRPHQGIYWRHWRGPNYSYKRAEMKIRY